MPAAGTAETVYFFRHAMLREAAYQLQPPQDRAQLHASAYEILDQPGLEPREAEPVALHALAATQGEALADMHRTTLISRAAQLLEIAGRHEGENLRFLDMLRLSRLGAELPGIAEPQRIYFLVMQEHALVMTGRGAGSRNRVEALLRSARACGGIKLLRVVRNTCAYARLLDSDFAASVDLYREQLADLLENPDATLAATTRNNLAIALENMGRHAEAMELYQQAAEVNRATGKARLQGQALDNIGNLLIRMGRPADALVYHRRALVLLEPLGPSTALAVAQSHAADALTDMQGHEAEAEAMYRLAIKTQIASGHAGGRGPILNNLGNLLSSVGRTLDAVTCYGEAVQWAQESGNRHSLLVAATNLADSRRVLGQPVLALEAVSLGKAAMAAPDRYFAPMLWLISAWAEAALGQREAGRAALARARELRTDLNTAPEFQEQLKQAIAALDPMSDASGRL